MKKRIIGVLIVIAGLMFAVTAQAANIVKSTPCGESASCTLDSDGVLTVTGTGEVKLPCAR